MLRDNLVELIEPMRNSAGAGLLALGIYQQKPASDDSLSCLENPRPEGAESSLTDNVTSPFPAEPRQLHPEKTRLVEFGRYAEANAKRQGKKPGTLDFLGFTHICARSRKGKFTVHVSTMKKRFKRGLTAIAEWCQENRHEPVDEQQKTLNAKLRGHYQYYGRPTNYRSIRKFYREVCHLWRKWLSRRTRGDGMTWEKFAAILRRHPLMRPRILHSWQAAESHA